MAWVARLVFGHHDVIRWRIEKGNLCGISLCEIVLIHGVNGHIRIEL